MKKAVVGSSQRLVCRVLGVARSTLTVRPEPARSRRRVDPELVERIRVLIEANPTHGYRMLTAWLRSDGLLHSSDIDSGKARSLSASRAMSSSMTS